MSNKPWTMRQQISNLQVKESAEAIEARARVLYRDMMRPKSAPMLPFLNNAIMPVELYLKSLSSSSVDLPTAWDPDLETVHAKPDAPTHNLQKVFESFPAVVHGLGEVHAQQT